VGIDVSQGADQDGLVPLSEKSYRSFISVHGESVSQLVASDDEGAPAQSIQRDRIA
jgi:hypothetical protein